MATVEEVEIFVIVSSLAILGKKLEGRKIHLMGMYAIVTDA